jgi:hypothetical protein
MTSWVSCHKWMSLFTACLLILVGCVAGMVIHDVRSQGPMWIVFGGFQDPGDGQGGGGFADQLASNGWAARDRIYQVQYTADVFHMEASTQEAMPGGQDAYGRLCSEGCIISGFSQGSNPAIELSIRTGHPGNRVYLFSGSEAATSIWHHYFLNDPPIEKWLQDLGFSTNRVPKPGTKHFYHQDDVYANVAPQCSRVETIWYMIGSIGRVHHVMNPNENFKVWTGPDGVENHEAGGDESPLTISGKDSPQPGYGCPPDGWSRR